MKTLLRIFFYLLYHQFAFAYDLVAAAVSFNRWKDWVMSVLPFIEGKRVLEIGHGPGHLQRALIRRGMLVVGIDESIQMGRLAKRNLKRAFLSQTQITPLSNVSPQPAYAQESLTRSLAQHLPFPDETFDTVVATFPAEYIFDPETLIETRRVLVPGGKFVILPGATITGRSIVDRLLAWISRVTGETPPDLSQIIRERSEERFAKTGFHVGVHEITVKSSLVFIMQATSVQLREEEQYA